MITKEMQTGRARKRKRAISSIKESQIQAACEEYLDLQGLVYIRIPDSIYMHTCSAFSPLKPWVKKEISRSIKGVADLTVLFPDGKYVCVELKKPGGKQSQGQIQWSRRIKDHYHVVYSVDEFITLIEGVLK